MTAKESNQGKNTEVVCHFLHQWTRFLNIIKYPVGIYIFICLMDGIIYNFIYL